LGFFENQEKARLATARLLWMYALSVVAIIACANLVVVPVYVIWSGTAATSGVYLAVSAVMLTVIFLGSAEIMARLSLGEAELAQLLSGRRVRRGSGVDAERRLINVVDEMAIASGLSAPPVYVLTREPGINAFAAGRSPNQAIVVVTRGALEELSRDELQAVIAHEFSHIINGDILLNLRAACVLQGIVFLSAIGRFMMRYYSGYGTDEGRRFVYLPLAVVGAGLFATGWVGLLCARAIQAAIAREREFLADASAVRYTRNADALCNALARIGLHREGSRILDWHADALAHMLFAGNAGTQLGSVFATHPPITERMRRADPHVSPVFYFERQRNRRPTQEKASAPATAAEAEAPKTIAPSRRTAVSALVASIGEPSAESLEYAAALLAYLPAPIREALGNPLGAQAVMLGLLIEEESTARERQLRALEMRGQGTAARKAEVLAPLLRQLDRAYRLPLAALALPVLSKELDTNGQDAFLASMRAAIEADGRITLSKFVLDTILEWNLGSKAKRSAGVRYRREELADECAVVMSLLAHAGNPEPDKARQAFERGKMAPAAAALLPRGTLQLGRVSAALERLRELAPLEKAPLLQRLGAIAEADGNVKLVEHELLRAIACALDCPMPPSIAALDPRLLRK
jgi:Zn-dependent protease with chaperone function